MPQFAPSERPSLEPKPVLGRELVLKSLDDPRTQRRHSDPSGVRPRPISSMPPPPDRTLKRHEKVAWALRSGLVVLALGVLSLGALWALLSAELRLTPILIGGLVISAVLALVTTTLRASTYQPTPVALRAHLPMLTVIVPAYNEGAMVRTAIESAVESGYPLDRLEVLAIDDGSSDNTWAHICASADAHPDVVVAIRQPKNRGKREALRTGFVRARGAFVVTVDSDSSIAPGALEALVAPMMRDERIAAVAGRVLVLNREHNALTRLLSAHFFLAFDLARAAQSAAGRVLSTPGQLSAYRTEAVLDVLPAWSGQTFLGKPCVVGVDRALTSSLLRAGFRTAYQRSAVAQTVVPVRWASAAQMLTRWERGKVRESLLLLPFLLRGGPKMSALDGLLELGRYPLGWLALSIVVAEAGAHPLALASLACAVLAAEALQNLLVPRAGNDHALLYGVGYSVLSALGLFWLFPYSLVTVRDERWLTR